MTAQELRAASDREVALLRMPEISKYLPYTFVTGQMINRIEASCGVCGEAIQSSQLRGELHSAIPNMVHFEASGRCCKCKSGTGFNVRIYNDKRQIALDGQPVSTKAIRISWALAPMLCRLRGLLTPQRNGEKHA